MAHHTAADLETIWDPDFGEGIAATVQADPEVSTTYEVNVLVRKDVEEVGGEFSGLSEKVTVLEFITSNLQAQLARGALVTAGGRQYVIEHLVDQDTYVSRYAVS